jgi:3-phosphoshikimate 1-carboxyvinyltransferase
VDCLPAVILARGLRGNAVSIRADKSSQFASALLMIAPLVESETRGAAEFSLKLAGAPVSEPYLRMTEELMRRFGVPARPMKTGRGWRVRRGQRYRARNFVVPPDASAASYFEAAAALCGRSVNIRGLGRLFEDSLQGDAAFAEYLERLGCAVCERGGLQILGPIQPKRFFPKPLDMADVSDVAITLAVVAPFLARPTTIRGLAHARLQETDRVAAVANELRKLGVRVECRADGWKIFPARQFTSAEIETYNDHRIAMAFSVLGLKDVMGDGQPWIRIRNPSCVSKTFPDFYERLAELRS